MIIPNMWKVIKFMFQTTNHVSQLDIINMDITSWIPPKCSNHQYGYSTVSWNITKTCQ